jgi:AcrR family transcriptional regulator
MPSQAAQALTDNSLKPSGRKSQIDREDLLAAALKLLGPHRSVSTLSLREVAREADIAPNSFYRHFRDIDELAIALIDLAGESLRKVIREARLRISEGGEVVRPSVEAFMEQLDADEKLLHILLREGSVGSDAFKKAVEHELNSFEDELRDDLVRLSQVVWPRAYQPALVAKAITRLVFAMGGTAMDLPKDKRKEVTDQIVEMVRMIVTGAQQLAIEEQRAAN